MKPRGERVRRYSREPSEFVIELPSDLRLIEAAVGRRDEIAGPVRRHGARTLLEAASEERVHGRIEAGVLLTFGEIHAGERREPAVHDPAQRARQLDLGEVANGAADGLLLAEVRGNHLPISIHPLPFQPHRTRKG